MNTENEIELSKEKSQELADVIETVQMLLWSVDVKYAKEVAEQLYNQASFQDSAAVLNPMYNPLKSDVLRKQSEMLTHLIKYIELGKEVGNLKQRINTQIENTNNIMKMFI